MLPLAGVDPRFLDRLARILVTVVTELSRLPNGNITITCIRVPDGIHVAQMTVILLNISMAVMSGQDP